MVAFKTLITGGAGFIGSYLAERLVSEAHSVTVIDNLSSGKFENLEPMIKKSLLTFVNRDLKETHKASSIVKECEVIFHLAANPEVRVGETHPKIHFQENIVTTLNLLEAIRKSKEQKTIVFASTSTVYGDASKFPTREDYGPLIPISTYGASKLACEALITSYAYTFNHRALILRLANIVGPRSNHGVIADFVRKIRENPSELEILGDGTQEKSYLYVGDCINAIVHLTNRLCGSNRKVEIYNLGSKDTISVKEIAKIVARTMSARNIKYSFTGGVDGGRGWKGDVKKMRLSVEKLLRTGWRPKYTSRQAIEVTARSVAKNSTSNS